MSLDKNKCDPELGDKVYQYLKKQKVEIPLLSAYKTPERRIEIVTKKFSEILEAMGLDPVHDGNLTDTALRVAKMYVHETLWGLDYNNFPKIATFKNHSTSSAMVIERNINVNTICSHHWQNIIGRCSIAYVPKNGNIIGLSKFHRVVEFFCRRPQVQERLVEQIYHALSYILKTPDIIVTVLAVHYCVVSRGVQDQHSDTVTTKLGGVFVKDLGIRNEYYTALKL